ncbi:PAS domain-containing protein [Anaerovorax odorimutans]|uniref:Stage 0 sporulation protein A homolog n=1 Tax=Anaerovorax odorimutans TaxID=109327 RepID=A0ABT1RTQ6_9FIRM|nr:PAS domain-containing hybrid sensor histidine kinase/response regulator [Anaerovorax odorimutans]MCQ4638545.1 PAS domain-containing protein [Anaerovorax odorimutans]
MWEKSLFTDQITDVLDDAPVSIYVSAVDDRELLYANRMAKKNFFSETGSCEHPCYHMSGFEETCPFYCTEKRENLRARSGEFRCPDNGKTYCFSGKTIDWGDRPADLIYISEKAEVERDEDSDALKQNFAEIFSSISCGLGVYEFDKGRISPLFHNPAFYEIMGYSEENIQQLETETSFLGVHPDDMDCLKDVIGEAIRSNGSTRHTYRIWNDRRKEYRWIHLEGEVKPEKEGRKLLYGIYNDVSEQIRLEKELTDSNEKMRDIVNAIPGGVAIYRVSDIFETIYFSEGVPELSGYTTEEYQELIKQDAAELTYCEDTEKVVSKAKEVIESQGIGELEFRKQHREGRIVWVRAQIKWIGEDNGCPLLHCVFHNITALKEAQSEKDLLINSIPGGIASYQVEGNRFIPTFFSEGVMALSGHTRQEYDEMLKDNALDIIYERDRERVLAAAQAAVISGEILDVSYRMRHKEGHLIWIHLNGRRMGPLSESMRFYAVFTGMSAETRLFQSVANETADGIYVIGRDNYELLYTNESKELFTNEKYCLGQKCYTALHGKTAPCEFCTLDSRPADGKEHDMIVEDQGKFYKTRFRETEWNGIPAYVKYIREVTEEIKTKQEKERLEQYFQTVVKNLPGGVAVVHYGKDGSMTPEFLSDGFAEMTGMTMDEAWKLYQQDAMSGVHPDDWETVKKKMDEYVTSGDSRCEIVYRLKKGKDSYVWVKNTLTMIHNDGGNRRIYAVYHEMTKELEEQDRIRRQYQELIMRHYHTPGPNALIVGHCNITKDVILDVIDYTYSDLLDTFGNKRNDFFAGIAQFIPDARERKRYLNTYLNEPARKAFARGDLEQRMECFIQLPKEPKGRYVQIKVNLVATPDSDDITGILTITDITERTIAERAMHQLSVIGYDFVADLDLDADNCAILSCNEESECVPPDESCFSEWKAYMLRARVVPRDQELYRRNLEPEYMRNKLKNGSYSFTFSIADEKGDIRMKSIMVFGTDLRLGRVCLSRTDITNSVREQQGLLRMIAYTFELACFIDLGSGYFNLHTRDTVLKNLPPHFIEDYEHAILRFVDCYGAEENLQEARAQFRIDTMVKRLEEKPGGYDFLFPYRKDEGERYKQINVLWGDVNHRTICLVRADVTDMLAEERQRKKELEKALVLAEEANRAKSDFLSSMSHDIRTPMNAIIGMTTLAIAHKDETERVADCLNKISISSKHLLSLINDVLDMSKIEQSRISLNRMKIFLPELVDQLAAIMTPQAEAAGLQLRISSENIRHQRFYGDSLRINQILINILSNAIKFTPENGRVDFLVEELEETENPACARYRFTICDTGIGMSKEFIMHIFDPFARSRSAGLIEGTGLGLSITKGLVDLMGGSISVESQINRGSTFCVELECEIVEDGEEAGNEERSREDSGAGDREKSFAGRYFLVAEDNSVNAEILCELLKMYGAECVVKRDGAQAVQAFLKAPSGTYDAVLMDIQMPKMNGYEATRTIRKAGRDDAKTIPIVAMTANAFAEDIQASFDAGMNAHIAKPIDVDALWETLNRVLTEPDQ